MTRGEMIRSMEQIIEEKWDARNWELALTTDKPVEIYMKSVDDRKAASEAVSIDDLSKEQRDWYRAT